jgi:hypothetical protein
MTFEMYATYRKKSQPEAWLQAIDVARGAKLPEVGDCEQSIFTGCGSTYYLSLAAAALYHELTGCIESIRTTTETVKAVEKFKLEKRGKEVCRYLVIQEGCNSIY